MTRIIKPDNQSGARLQANQANQLSTLARIREEASKVCNVILLRYGDDVYLKPVLNIDYTHSYIINIRGKIHVYELDAFSFQNYWKINLNSTKTGWDATDKIGYRVDASTYTSNDRCLIWAFVNAANTQIDGFAATELPKTTGTTIANGTMGSLATLTNVTNARMFRVGATVMLWYSTSTEFNYGVVQSITSNTAMTVKLYPSISVLGNTNITGAYEIEQVDNFFPWNGRTDISDESDRTFRPNYQLIGMVDLNEPLIDETVKCPVGSIIAWHKNIISPALSLPEGWMECSGGVVNDPASPLFGITLPDLNLGGGTENYGKFLRGGVTSGVMQEGTDIWQRPNTAANVTSDRGNTRIYNHDGTYQHSLLWTDIAGTNKGPATTDYSRIRPTNMSVIWIIKIR